jgi:indolepyruvate ferredoxin oxidoreductase beta subunit
MPIADWTGRFLGHGNQTTSVTGYLRFLMLPLRLRPRTTDTTRAGGDRSLAQFTAAAANPRRWRSKIAQCARLIKGYGDTWKRGAANYADIEARVIRPVLAGRIAVARGIDAIASARTAALVDPEGEGLARCLADIERSSGLGIAAE